MNGVDLSRAERIERIKRYKQLKKIERCKKIARVNLLAFKFLTFAAIPSLTACPATMSGTNSPTSNDYAYLKENQLAGMLSSGDFSLDDAISLVAEIDGELFLRELNAQHDSITSLPKGKDRNAYIQSLFGNINYCNIAVIKALKASEADYFQEYLNNISNPALCEAFVNYVRKTNPDCIRAVKNMKTADLKRGDVVVLHVKRRSPNAVTSSGRHTVTYDGKEFISFNSTTRYQVTSEAGDVIDMQKLRQKELQKKVKNMTHTQALSYLIHISKRVETSERNKTKSIQNPTLIFAERGARTI